MYYVDVFFKNIALEGENGSNKRWRVEAGDCGKTV